jgi:mycothiol synthase
MANALSNSWLIRPAIPNDAEAVAELMNTCAIERTGNPEISAQQVRAAMQMPGLALETDTRQVFNPEGQLVGFAFVQDSAPHTRPFVMTEVHPEYRGMGIGVLMCQWVEERARQSIPDAPVNGRVALLQQRLSTDTIARKLLLGQGYQVVRHNFRMLIEMDEPPSQPEVPEGINIRPFIRDQEGEALVRTLREAFRDNWGYVDRPFEEEYQRWMHLLERDPDCDPSPFWFVAVNGAEIAGASLCQPQLVEDPEMAWVYIVGVRPAWRRRGIALALLRHSFGALYRWGKRKIGLEVDTQNATGATRLYEKAGMHVERQYDFFEKELRAGGAANNC